MDVLIEIVKNPTLKGIPTALKKKVSIKICDYSRAAATPQSSTS